MTQGTVIEENVILTGASRGLGSVIASTMWQQGANLLLVARSEEALSQLQKELMSSPHPASRQHTEILGADLAEPQTPEKIVSYARSLWKRVDVLVNNAATPGPIGKLWDNIWDQWQAAIQVNLLAPVALSRAVVPWMKEFRGGKIINLSGGGATSPRPNFSAYGTAKAAFVRFSEVLAQEVREDNIQVNCIAPGAMNTEMLDAIRKAGPEKAGINEYEAALDKLQSDEESLKRAAALCCFLASPASNGLTGKLISAVWDPWERLAEHLDELNASDIYTLRRILPQDRGKDWW